MRLYRTLKVILVLLAMLAAVLYAVAATAQNVTPPAKPDATPATSGITQPAATVGAPAPAAQASNSAALAAFLVKFDKLQALYEARADADKKRAEYEAAVKVLTEQSNTLVGELRSLIPPGHTWNPATREFVKLPAPPAPEAEKPKEKP